MSRLSPPSTLIISITNDNSFRLRILSIPDGYRLFRTDSVHSERMQDIRGVSGESIAFHMRLYSSAVFPVLDRTRHQFTSIPHFDQTPKVSQSSPYGRYLLPALPIAQHRKNAAANLHYYGQNAFKSSSISSNPPALYVR